MEEDTNVSKISRLLISPSIRSSGSRVCIFVEVMLVVDQIHNC